MADRKPPRLDGDDRAVLLGLLRYQRESFAAKAEGIDDAAAARSPVGSGTSVLWLVNHMADAEVVWVLARFTGRPMSEVAPPPATTMAGGLHRYRRVWDLVDAVVAAEPDLGRPCPPFDDEPPPTLRWILAHLLQETARHAGHLDILCELIDGRTGR